MAKCKIGKDFKDTIFVVGALFGILTIIITIFILFGYLLDTIGIKPAIDVETINYQYYLLLGFNTSILVVAIAAATYLVYIILYLIYNFFKIAIFNPGKIKRFFIECEDNDEKN